MIFEKKFIYFQTLTNFEPLSTGNDFTSQLLGRDFVKIAFHFILYKIICSSSSVEQRKTQNWSFEQIKVRKKSFIPWMVNLDFVIELFSQSDDVSNVNQNTNVNQKKHNFDINSEIKWTLNNCNYNLIRLDSLLSLK